MRIATALLAVMIATNSSCVHADEITYSDSSFADADWTSVIITNEIATTWNSFQSPGLYRQTNTISLGSPTGGLSRQIHFRDGAVYAPSTEGELLFLDYSLDMMLIDNSVFSIGMTFGLAIRQNDTYYLAVRSFLNPIGWQTLSDTSLVAADFVFLEGTGPMMPDFSETGSQIEFGYYLSVATGVANQGTSASGAVDNWAVVLNTAGAKLGDVNLDGVVNLLDVAPFVVLLSSGGFQAEADINEDGVVNLLDIDGFVALLSGG